MIRYSIVWLFRGYEDSIVHQTVCNFILLDYMNPGVSLIQMSNRLITKQLFSTVKTLPTSLPTSTSIHKFIYACLHTGLCVCVFLRVCVKSGLRNNKVSYSRCLFLFLYHLFLSYTVTLWQKTLYVWIKILGEQIESNN